VNRDEERQAEDARCNLIAAFEQHGFCHIHAHLLLHMFLQLLEMQQVFGIVQEGKVTAQRTAEWRTDARGRAQPR